MLDIAGLDAIHQLLRRGALQAANQVTVVLGIVVSNTYELALPAMSERTGVNFAKPRLSVGWSPWSRDNDVWPHGCVVTTIRLTTTSSGGDVCLRAAEMRPEDVPVAEPTHNCRASRSADRGGILTRCPSRDFLNPGADRFPSAPRTWAASSIGRAADS